jgi:hypothetical protein
MYRYSTTLAPTAYRSSRKYLRSDIAKKGIQWYDSDIKKLWQFHDINIQGHQWASEGCTYSSRRRLWHLVQNAPSQYDHILCVSTADITRESRS